MRDALFLTKLRVFLGNWRWRSHRRAAWVKARLRQLRRRVRRTALAAPCVPAQHSRLVPSSPFVLESLEPRLLLAADLTGVLQAPAAIDPAVPTNTASAVVQVQNLGNQAVSQSQIGVYASLDTVLDSSDLLLGTANTGQVSAGQSKNVTVNLTLPNTLQPVTYTLLAKVDHANALAENSETNNVAIGGTVNGTWQFGAVPGRAGNTTLTLREADGTTVTFNLTGPGLGEVIKDGTNWDLKVTGTTASSAVTITTNSGGNGRVTLNDVHVVGSLAAFTAATTDLTGTMAIDGPVNISGILPGAITLRSVSGGTLAVPSVEALTILGSTTNATFLIGATLGQDGQPGGTGVNADTYGQGRIGLFTVTGAMTNTAVRVGIDPVDGTYGNGNDQLIGGTTSAIDGIIIGGTLSADTRFYAGRFPTQYLNGLTLKPTAGDFHFISNFSGPSLTAALQEDSGSSTSDRLTNNPAITGTVTDPQGIATFTAGFGATPTVNILSDRQADGSFTLSRTRLEQINGGPLTDGTYVLTLMAMDTVGNATQFTVAFTLDTQVPTLTLDLDPAFDSAPVGDQQTTNALVTLVGQTEANAAVELVELGLTTTADASGQFSFTNVALTLGANAFTVRATDPAGNQRTEARTITRLAVNQAPVLDLIGSQTVNEEVLLTFTAQATDPDAGQGLTFSLENGASGQVPAGASIDPTTGLFAWTPTEAQGPGTVTFDVVVTDNGSPSTLSDRETITVTVNEVNQAPTLEMIPNQTVTAGQLLTFTAVGHDNDAPANPLTYSLEGTVPSGASIDPTTGVFTWMPTNTQVGPQSITVRVTDNGTPNLFSEQVVSVTVNAPENQAPVLTAIGNKVVDEGQELTFTATATDPDAGQTLTFSLENAPEGAAIDPVTGVFTWISGADRGPATYQFDVVGTDNGSPSLSDRETIAVTILEPDTVFFQGLGDLPGGSFESLSFSVSADGTTVVGRGTSANGLEAFRWTVNGIQGLGDVPGGIFHSDAVAVSADGLTVAGSSVGLNGGEAFRWTASDGLVGLGDLPGGSFFSAANGISPDGTIIVGTSSSSNGIQEAFRWSTSEGMVGLGDLPGGGFTSIAFAVAQTPGTGEIVIVGMGRSASGLEAFRWTAAGGMVGLGDLPGGTFSSNAIGISADGTVIVGNGSSISGTEAFRWTASGGMQGLGMLPGDLGSSAMAVTGDGAVVVGSSSGLTNGAVAFIWDAVHGMRKLQDVLVNDLGLGAELAGWNLINAVEISPDGRTITGIGTNPQGQVEAWRVRLPLVQANQAPVLNAIGNQTVDEGQLLTFTATATDPNAGQTLTFSLENGVSGQVPAGASIDPTTGVFTWTPTEAQGPGTFTFDVVVADNGSPALSDRETVTVTVNDVISSAFRGLGDLPGGVFLSQGLGLSADGSVVVGLSQSASGQEAFRWTSGGGMIGLGDLAAGGFGSEARGISADGTVIVGRGTSASGLEAFRWTSSGGMVGLGDLIGGTFSSLASAVSTDGNVVVGSGRSASGQEAFRWTSAEGMVGLGDLPGGAFGSQANAVSADGTVVVGRANDLPGVGFRWTAADGMVRLDGMQEAFGISADGTTVVGWSDGGVGLPLHTAVRWTTAEGVQLLDPLGMESLARSISGNGTVVVGSFGSFESPTGAFIWTAGHGMRDLRQMLVTDYGLGAALTGWTLTEARSISPDGGTISGIGINPDGQIEAWCVVLANRQTAPSLAPIGSKSISEGQLLTFTAIASDLDVPKQVLTFSLTNGTSGQVPAGAAIDPVTGVFTWTPTEAQGPGTYTFDVVVTDDGTPALSDRETVTVTVNDVISSAFRGLGDLPGGVFLSQGLGLSADGSVVVGLSQSASGQEAFRWTSGGGMIGLGDFTGGVFSSQSQAVSADGTVVVGGGTSASGSEAFRWTASDGLIGLGDLAGGIVSSEARSVSADGTVIVGFGRSASGQEAFRWTSAEGMVGLGDLPGGAFGSRANAVSADGSIIVGRGDNLPGAGFRWTAADGMVRLDGMQEAFGISADGTTVVGWSDGGGGLPLHTAVRWTAAGGTTVLNPLGPESTALAVSGNGAVVVGSIGQISNPTDAFIWDAVRGMRNLQSELISSYGLGVALSGWTLTAAQAISPDGNIISGIGINPNGQTEAWCVSLVPSQTTNQTPVLNALGNKTATVGQALTFTATATDPDAEQTLTFGLQGTVPAGAALDPTTGVFTWTPTAGQVGQHTFTVRVSDNGSPVLFDDETITVTVNDAVSAGIQPGSLVISKIMADPSAVPDFSGEWFEVFNPTTTMLELRGLVVRDDGTNQFTINQLLNIAPGGRLVFGNNGNLAANGGILVDFVYTNFTLANSGDVIEIFNGTTSIDRVNYGAAGFPAVQPGYSLSLDPAKLTAVLNDDGANWTVEAIPTPLPVLSIGEATVAEGNSDTVAAVFTVTMGAASSQTVSVSYATTDITANAGTDYVATSGVLVFAPGERSKTISVTVNGDTLVEPNESFAIVLSSAVGATIADGQGIGTISNDDSAQSPAIPGLLVITEIMADPSAVPDTSGEWFEIFNPTPVPWDLQGLTVRDDGTNQFAITQSVVIAPGGYLVLGNNGDVNTNGGVQVDFVYTNFTLANFGDVIEIVNGAVTIDRVNYDLVGFPSAIGGQSLSLSSSAMDAFRNDIGSNWSVGAPTPGAVNPGVGGGSGQPTAVNDTYTVQQNSTLMSGTTLVKDILAGVGASNPTDLVNVNGTLFFAADDAVNGTELWKSDGTIAGTVLVKDLQPGSSSVILDNLTNVNGTLFFNLQDALWKSDGTAAGTVMVKGDLGLLSASTVFSNLNGTLFFTADDGVNGRELWKSDGTAAGTVMVKNIRTSALGSDPAHLTNVGGTLFFDAFDATNGRELWKSDGTIAGTVLVKDLTAGSGSTTFNSEYANLNGALFFGTNTGLWRSDGTAAGTVQVKSGVNLQSLITSGGVLYFTSGGLWKSDGTTAGTVQLISTNVENLTDVNGTVYFRTDDGVHGSELWKSNGTVAGTALVKDIAATGSSQPSQLTNVNGTLYFIATDGVNGAELWKSDGTAGGTAMVKDIVPGAGQSVPQLLTNVNGTLFFVADDGVNGRELWASGLAANLLANDSDPDSPPLTANLGTGPTNGTLVLNSDGTFTYRPSAGFTGTDTFTYTVSDGTTTSSAATVTITVTP